MKTYQDYVKEWENSTESRDLSFEEWLMLQLERKDQHFKEFWGKACEWLNKRLYPTVKVQKGEDIDVIDRWRLIDEFRKAMDATTEKPTSLTWEDVKRIVNIADDIVSNYRESHGVIWDEQAYYKEVLTKFNEERK